MKKLVMVAAMMIAAVSVQAQSNDIKHEVAISYGAASNSTWLATMEDFAQIAGTFGIASYRDGSFFGPLGVEYFYKVTPKIRLGGIGVYARETKDVYLGNKHYDDDCASNTYITVMPAAKFNWIDKKYFGLYSKVGLGMTIKKQKQEITVDNTRKEETDNGVFFAFQATAIGIEAGAPNIRAFAELGVGEQGIINAGIRARF